VKLNSERQPSGASGQVTVVTRGFRPLDRAPRHRRGSARIGWAARDALVPGV